MSGQTGTQAAFAKAIGVSRQYVSALAKNGRLVFTADGQVDFDASRARIADNADPNREDVRERHAAARAGKGYGRPDARQDEAESAADSFRAHRARKMAADADRAELEAEQLAGRLIARDDVQFVLDDLCLSFVTALDNLPGQIAPVVLPLNTLEDVTAAIADVTGAIIDNLHKQLEDRRAEQ